MTATECHADRASRSPARDLILNTLGAKRVAEWCGVTEAAVYQWLSRGTEDAPVPARYVSLIVRGAKREGVSFDLAQLMPGLGDDEPGDAAVLAAGRAA
jgi:hypothetical protein